MNYRRRGAGGGYSVRYGVRKDRVGQDGVSHMRQTTIDSLQVGQQIQMHGTGFQALDQTGGKTGQMAIGQMAMAAIDPFLVPQQLGGELAVPGLGKRFGK